jgi:hypothetical protein
MAGDTQAARELVLYIDNDAELYRGQATSIHKNLVNKIAAGKWKKSLAVKGFGYLVESGAKKYFKDYGTPGDKWFDMFDVATRKIAATELTEQFKDEADLGNYDDLLQKKYKGKRANPGADEQMASELVLFIDNDAELYRQQVTPIQKNLVNKIAAGKWSKPLAVKLYGYLVESGAKKYHKQFGSKGDKWFDMFNPATRKLAATELTEQFKSTADDGYFDDLLFKKYQGKRGNPKTSRLGTVSYSAREKGFKRGQTVKLNDEYYRSWEGRTDGPRIPKGEKGVITSVHEGRIFVTFPSGGMRQPYSIFDIVRKPRPVRRKRVTRRRRNPTKHTATEANVRALSDNLQKQYDARVWLMFYRDDDKNEPHDGLVISQIKIQAQDRDQGIATLVLRTIIEFADRHQLILATSPTKDFGAKVTRLRAFLKRHNFVSNTGRKRDLRYMETMIRHPR